MRLLSAAFLGSLLVAAPAEAQERRPTFPSGATYRAHTTSDSVHHLTFRPGPALPTVAEVAALWGLAGTAPGAGPAGGREVVVVDPGQGVEADNITDVAFSTDGTRVLVTHLMTDNLTVLDARTRQVLANVPVGDLPIDVAANEDVAVVLNAISRDVHVVDLATYATRAVIPLSSEPARVVLSPDGRTAYIATDNPDSCQIVDLTTDTVVGQIGGFPMGLVQITFTFAPDYVDRRGFRHAPFVVTPDGARIVVGRQDAAGVTALLVFDIATRALIADIPVPGFPYGLDIAADGSAVVFGDILFEHAVGRLNLATLTVSDLVVRPGYESTTSVEVAASADGRRAVFGNYSAATGLAEAVVVHFDGSPDTRLPVDYPRTLTRSGDGRFVLFSGGRSTILELDSETVAWTRDRREDGYYAAASPTGSGFATANLFIDEGVAFVGTAGGTVTDDGYTETGEPAEGDGPFQVRALPGGRALVANLTSGNLTIIDATTASVEAVLPAVQAVRDVAVTADGSRAAVVGEGGGVRLVDLSTGQALAEADLPAYYFLSVAPTPDGAVLFTAAVTAGQDVVAVLRKDGAVYRVVATYPGYAPGLVGTPDGAFVLAPHFRSSGTSATYVFDGRTGSLIGEELVGTANFKGAASPDGRHAVLFRYQGGTLTTFAFDAAGYSVEGEFTVPADVVDVAFVSGQPEVWITAGRSVRRHDVRTGALLETRAVPGVVRRVAVAQNGEPVVYATGSASPILWSDGVATPLPYAFVTDFAYLPAANSAIVVGGLDKTVVVRGGVVAEEPGAASAAASLSVAGPNPSSVTTMLTLTLADAGLVVVTLHDVLGRRVAVLHDGVLAAGAHTLPVDASALPAGTYLARVAGSVVAAAVAITVAR